MTHRKSWIVTWIVALKVVKCVLLAALGAFLLGYLHRNPVDLVLALSDAVNVPSSSRLFNHAMVIATGLTVAKQVALAATSFGYATLLGIEAVGLTRRRSWARWFTIGITASLLPFEVYEIVRRPGEPIRIATFIVNVAIVIYLYKRREVFEP